MNDGGLEQMVLHLVVIRNGANDVRADVSFVVEWLQATPDACVCILDKFRLGIRAIKPARCNLGIDPLLDFNSSRTIVKFICEMGCLL